MSHDMGLLAKQRLQDYARFKGMTLPVDDIMQLDLISYGFDITDLATIIGEIQCDCLRLIDWQRPVEDIRTLEQLVSYFDGQPSCGSVGELFRLMKTSWTREEYLHITENAYELSWPS